MISDHQLMQMSRGDLLSLKSRIDQTIVQKTPIVNGTTILWTPSPGEDRTVYNMDIAARQGIYKEYETEYPARYMTRIGNIIAGECKRLESDSVLVGAPWRHFVELGDLLLERSLTPVVSLKHDGHHSEFILYTDIVGE